MQHEIQKADDQKIRTNLFSTSNLIIKKIRKLEKDHSDFILCDQMMYHDWRKLTFREELQEIEALEKRQKILHTFQIHLNYVAATSSVSPKEAYAMLKEEEGQYQCGDDTWKYVIDNLRKTRYESATQAYAQALPGVSKKHDEPAERVDFSEIFFKDNSALSGLKRTARSVYHYLSGIDNQKIEQHLAVPNAGYRLFKESLQITIKCGDWDLLGRLWKSADASYQQRYLHNMPLHLKKFWQKVISENDRDDADSELRMVYSKLARLLHPDRLVDETVEYQQWASVKWQRAQIAYQEGDAAALKRLELLCLAELGQLNDLTLAEISQCSELFQTELESLKKKLALCTQHPAWKFSSRRSYDSLKQSEQAEIKKRLIPLRADVSAIEVLLEGYSSNSPHS
ncbi:hypothetical protein B9G69_011770 [Bdellovibrio sp. SKB1291214]|uniref:hypothetical protein n=1 Tax=Bdellovibrio sp. SKB1291214 TaxID=1732569 RepID=UPI000B5165CF|nr:hypothetical protein [Bdellovibrio sp. SKB1291214]UYL07724.1 hypothetical protein B9G69_011770 [Bdellovibrio sp. SKB1291214]